MLIYASFFFKKSPGLTPPFFLSFFATSSQPPFTSSRWGNRSAYYGLWSDTIRLLILVPVQVSPATLPGCWTEPQSCFQEQMLTALFHNYCHRQTDCRNKYSHTDRSCLLQRVLSRKIMSAGVWCRVLAPQQVGYLGQTLISNGWKHHIASTWM